MVAEHSGIVLLQIVFLQTADDGMPHYAPEKNTSWVIECEVAWKLTLYMEL